MQPNQLLLFNLGQWLPQLYKLHLLFPMVRWSTLTQPAFFIGSVLISHALRLMLRLRNVSVLVAPVVNLMRSKLFFIGGFIHSYQFVIHIYWYQYFIISTVLSYIIIWNKSLYTTIHTYFNILMAGSRLHCFKLE